MATFETDVSICNLGLAKFGGGEISGLDDTDDLSTICANLYPATRDYLLSIHAWRFVSGKRSLAKSASVTPENEWSNAFQLPTVNFSGPWAVFADGSSRPVHDFEIYENYIYCDYETVIIDYIKQVDEAFFPPWFVNFLATAFAAEACGPVADKVSKSEQLRTQAFGPPGANGRGGMFAQCRRLDAQLQATKSIFQNGDPLTSARNG